MRKYEFTGRTMQLHGITLKQIVAVMDFEDVMFGYVGGWIDNEKNLSHNGDAWVYGNAKVLGNAEVLGNANVWDDAEVLGNARIYTKSHVLVVGAIGSRDDFTTFYRDKDNGITVKCGCFNGKIDKFIEQVRMTHGDNRHAQVYLAAAELAKTSIELSPEETKKKDNPELLEIEG